MRLGDNNGRMEVRTVFPGSLQQVFSDVAPGNTVSVGRQDDLEQNRSGEVCARSGKRCNPPEYMPPHCARNFNAG